MYELRFLFLLPVIVVASGCSWHKTSVPHRLAHPSFPAPVVQRVLDQAATQAVTISLDGINDQVAGREVCVEVNGVLPMSDETLLRRVRGLSEAGLASKGALVRPCCTLIEVETDVGGMERTYRCAPPAGYRAVVGVGVGGIDESYERKFVGRRLIGPLATFGVGAILWAALAAPNIPPVETGEIVQFSIGNSLAGLSILVAGLWVLISPPFDYAVDLDARVEADVALLPQEAALPHYRGIGKGESKIRITDDVESPYSLAR